MRIAASSNHMHSALSKLHAYPDLVVFSLHGFYLESPDHPDTAHHKRCTRDRAARTRSATLAAATAKTEYLVLTRYPLGNSISFGC